jgi:ABC-type multidrug transport system ATPase subunit
LTGLCFFIILSQAAAKYSEINMIKVCDLYKNYNKQVALGGVSFEVDKATTFGLLGPNGAGKTTTISILCGLLKPDSGSVSLKGKSDPSKMDVRRSLSVVPQSLTRNLRQEKTFNFSAGCTD